MLQCSDDATPIPREPPDEKEMSSRSSQRVAGDIQLGSTDGFE
jgi:hypothetical protein